MAAALGEPSPLEAEAQLVVVAPPMRGGPFPLVAVAWAGATLAVLALLLSPQEAAGLAAAAHASSRGQCRAALSVRPQPVQLTWAADQAAAERASVVHWMLAVPTDRTLGEREGLLWYSPSIQVAAQEAG